MPLADIVFRTTACDGPNCKGGKDGGQATVTFNQKDQADISKAHEENPWLNTGRVLQTADGRIFFFHDDVCTVEFIATGSANPPEQKKILEVPTGAEYAIKAAAAAAAQKRFADQAIREGQPASIQMATS